MWSWLIKFICMQLEYIKTYFQDNFDYYRDAMLLEAQGAQNALPDLL